MFTTLIGWAGCEVPADRVIDGVDQGAFFGGDQDQSNRQGFLFWNGDKLYGVKWVRIHQEHSKKEARDPLIVDAQGASTVCYGQTIAGAELLLLLI